jgi:DNA polymerase type B, organellar and viral
VKIEHSFKGEDRYCEQCDAPRRAHRGKRKPKPKKITFIGIDGEGKTEHFGPWPGKHRYTMLCASDEHGRHYVIENPRGLRTKQCLEFMFTLPTKNTKIFAYSFSYDLAKILEDLDDQTLYKLVRPNLRRRITDKRKNIVCVYWPTNKPEYSLNWINGRLTLRKCQGKHVIADPRTGGPIVAYKWGPSVVINDIWKFFQGKFTKALEDWKIPEGMTDDERKTSLENMREMKDKRSNFDQLNDDDIRTYCLEECQHMASLSRKLITSHVQAGIPLKHYFGAGSSAEAMMLAMNIKQHVQTARSKNPTPDSVEYAQRCAFFGGRFELARIGPIRSKIYTYDISSAYPYQLVFLPCLIHGKWEHTTDSSQISKTKAALIRYTLEEPAIKRPWAPFPFRLKNGSIAFPETSGGGWVWHNEYLKAIQLFDNIIFHEAWLYHCDCDCQPFKDIPQYYTYRIHVGKEGPGIVIKLGINSNYGKTAQTIGGEPGEFQSWAWAGLITSGCRGQVLEAMLAHKDLDNMLMVATDGIATLEPLTLPTPINTGTSWLPCPEPEPGELKDSPDIFRCINHGPPQEWLTNKPLGGWEEKIIPNGMFLARPGIYFPLEPTKSDIKRIRARGLGRAAVWDNWQKIIDAYEKGEPGIKIHNLSLFRGIKTSITRRGNPGSFTYHRKDDYGRWVNRPIEMTFSPLPKREPIIGEGGRLTLRNLPDLTSAPYNKGIISPEAAILLQQALEEEEQPDGGDLTDCDAWAE